jgi:hypothetical protein
MKCGGFGENDGLMGRGEGLFDTDMAFTVT